MNSNARNNRSIKIGDIGWGVNEVRSSLNSLERINIEKPHVRYWDDKQQSNFIEMSGKFMNATNKIFNYESLQRLSIRDQRNIIKNMMSQNKINLTKFFVNKRNDNYGSKEELKRNKFKCLKFMKLQNERNMTVKKQLTMSQMRNIQESRMK